MIAPTNGRQWPGVDEVVEAYESARARDGQVDLNDYVPDADHPHYLAILCELVRVELEYSWRDGRPKRMDHYRARFPDLFRDGKWVQAIAFEEYRQRRQAGEDPSPLEYRRRFGADTLDWPSSFLDSLEPNYEGGTQDHGSSPSSFPPAGSTFLGFQLQSELGRGAFGRVYLARQGDLANRPVALKVSTDLIHETQALAQLQHTNIVPIYSVHRSGRLHAVCMPYLGPCTLAHVLTELRQHTALPDSGADLLGMRERALSTSDAPPARSTGNQHAENANIDSRVEGPAGATPRLTEVRATTQLERLRGLGYVQAVLWMAARVADGLAHAHERGILHRDLKPANILLGDDGEPLLLDFNLAADTKLPGPGWAALIGGTLPYMAPEHLRALRGEDRILDARCDLYSLGVILFELLTGNHPFETRRGPVHEVLPRMIAERLGPLPKMRAWNARISPAVEAIVARCLHPEPSHRYQTARELHEDLDRQLNDLPLVHAPERSIRERFAKWSRRHKRLTSMTTLGLIAGCLLLGVTAWFLDRQRQLHNLEAADSLQRLTRDARQVDLLLGSRDAGPVQINEGVDLCRKALEPYHVLDDPAWLTSPLVVRLPLPERQRLRLEIGQLLLLYARSVIWEVEATESSAVRSERPQLASRLNALAEACFGETAPSRALWLQRAGLARLAGREDEAQQLLARAHQVPLRTPMDRFWDVLDRLDQSGDQNLMAAVEKRREIMAEVQRISRVGPQNFVNWLILGNCYVRLGQLREAASCYSTGIALRPEVVWAYVNRGLVHLDLKEHSEALADFDQVIALRPEMVEAFINRALARMGLGEYAGAVADLSRALELPDAPVRVFFLRARARDRLGDKEGAARDRASGLERRPNDELSWVVRGLARLDSDPQGALSDFDAALLLNPRSRSALQDKAHVLAERLGRTEEAIQALSTALRYHPDYVDAIAARGVYYARLNRREPALADARAALAQTDQPGTIYQVAGIYALASRKVPGDRQEAMRLLAIALRKDPSWLRVVPVDHELDPIRNEPEFRELIRALTMVSQVSAVAQPNSSKE
jgi:eukaryotic-like serine/threonine-protein kinase